MKVLVDTNVLLDVLMGREPFLADSVAVWAMAEERRVEGLVSVLSASNVFYMVRRVSSRPAAFRAVGAVCTVFRPVACDAETLRRAIDAGMNDLEDAIQHVSAAAAGAGTLVTRNVRDFPDIGVSVVTPAAFLAAHGRKR